MRVAIYCRISQDADDRRVGVKRQEMLCRRLALEEWPGADLAAYVDNDKSGADSARPQYRRLLEDVRAGQVVQVVTAEQSRLTRDPAEWERLVVTLTAAGIEKVYTLAGPVTVGEGDRLVGRILAAVSAEERDRTIARIGRALDANAERGAPAGGRPYGFRLTGERGAKTYVVDPGEAEVIEELASRVECGEPLGAIVDDLNARGVPAARGGAWRTTSAKAVLLKPAVAGLRVHRGEIVGAGNWPAIIDRSRWDALVLRLTGERIVTTADGRLRRVGSAHRRPRKRLLTGGLAVCGNCGTPLVATLQARRHGPRVAAYGCHPTGGPDACSGVSMMADQLEELVSAAVLLRIDTPEVIDALRPAPDDDTRRLAADLADAEATLEDLGRLLGAGEIDPTAFRSAHDTARDRAARARDRLAAASALPVDADPASLPDRWASLPLGARRAIIETLIAEVSVAKASKGGPRFDPTRVSLVWRI